MADRLDVLKTYKLYIDGKFPRSESGRSLTVAVEGGVTHLCRASRKDLRDAVEAARRAQPGWAGATAYLRGQILYRMAEMLEGKRSEFSSLLSAELIKEGQAAPPRAKRAASRSLDEVTAAIDRLIAYAGWADKYSQVLGCNNPVSGPYYNFTVPEPTGVIAVVAPDELPLLGLVSLIAPVICSGNTVVAIASERSPVAAAVLGEVFATSDLPAGVVNILTGLRDELLTHVSTHREIDGIHAAGLNEAQRTLVRTGMAENIKRVVVHELEASKNAEGVNLRDAKACSDPWWIEPFVEMKTMWHPASS